MGKYIKLADRVRDVMSEKIEIVSYDPKWVDEYNKEAKFLRSEFGGVIKRIEHFGSTSIPGLLAKPIVDILVEVSSFKEAKKTILPRLKKLRYQYFWRPIFDKPPNYMWFIKRNAKGERTHHIHTVTSKSPLWDRVCFRDYLRLHPELVLEYANLKKGILTVSNDRNKYIQGKKEFLDRVEEEAKRYFK